MYLDFGCNNLVVSVVDTSMIYIDYNFIKQYKILINIKQSLRMSIMQRDYFYKNI
jgi:hypothetical protein